MSDHQFWLSEAQFDRIRPLLPNKVRGVPRVDDRRVISGIIHVIRYGLIWRHAPSEYGPHKTLYNRFVRWSEAGVFNRIFAALAAEGRATGTGDGDNRRYPPEGAPHRSQSAKKGALSRCIGRTRGGLNSKLHAVCDGDGKPLIMLLTEGQVSDHRGAAMMFNALPPDAETLIGDKGYDSDRFREALAGRGIAPCIPGRAHRKKPVACDAGLYKQRNLVERMFGRLKDWRRIATRYDRCAHTLQRHLHRRNRHILVMSPDRCGRITRRQVASEFPRRAPALQVICRSLRSGVRDGYERASVRRRVGHRAGGVSHVFDAPFHQEHRLLEQRPVDSPSDFRLDQFEARLLFVALFRKVFNQHAPLAAAGTQDDDAISSRVPSGKRYVVFRCPGSTGSVREW